MNTNDNENRFCNNTGQGNNNRQHLQDNEKNVPHPDGTLPEDDPALINPDELATFPEEEKNPNLNSADDDDNSHIVSRKSSPVREGRNITRTDTTADNDGGFM